VRTYWKTSTTPLVSHGAWRARLEKKNRRQGTSAPTLAAAWSGPIELLGALHGLSQFAELVLERVVVEAESQFDEHGGPRNHDAVVHGHLPDGDRVVVCVEAKAGEALGQTVEHYAKAAKHKLETNRPTNAPKRLARLLERYACDYDVADDRVRLMRYQLLSALAGTETEAAAAGADHAVLMIHEFLTDTRHKGQDGRPHGRLQPLHKHRL
jgi:hypothetical protein